MSKFAKLSAVFFQNITLKKIIKWINFILKLPADWNKIEVDCAIEHIRPGECFSSIALAIVT